MQKRVKELEKQMDEIVQKDGSIADWHVLRDELNIIQNIKIPCEKNRLKPSSSVLYDVPTYQIPRYV